MQRWNLDEVLPPLLEQRIQVGTPFDRNSKDLLIMPHCEHGFFTLIAMTQTTFERVIIDPTSPTSLPIAYFATTEQQRNTDIQPMRIRQHIPENIVDNRTNTSSILHLTSCTSLRHIRKHCRTKRSWNCHPMSQTNQPSDITIQEVADILDSRRQRKKAISI